MDLVKSEGIDKRPPFAEIGVEPLSAAFDAARLGDAVRRCARADQDGAARSEAHRRTRQHLRLRSAAPRAHRADPPGFTARQRQGQADRRRACACPGDPRGARGGDRSRRLDAARPSPTRRRARLFPACVRRLRPRGRPCPRRGCHGTIARIVQGGRSTSIARRARAGDSPGRIGGLRLRRPGVTPRERRYGGGGGWC